MSSRCLGKIYLRAGIVISVSAITYYRAIREQRCRNVATKWFNFTRKRSVQTISLSTARVAIGGWNVMTLSQTNTNTQRAWESKDCTWKATKSASQSRAAVVHQSMTSVSREITTIHENNQTHEMFSGRYTYCASEYRPWISAIELTHGHWLMSRVSDWPVTFCTMIMSASGHAHHDNAICRTQDTMWASSFLHIFLRLRISLKCLTSIKKKVTEDCEKKEINPFIGLVIGIFYRGWIICAWWIYCLLKL